jgi:PAS domain S-box-containing protein
LSSIGDAVIATDREGRVTFLNSTAGSLIGWVPEEAVGKTLGNVFRIVNEQTRQPVENPVRQVLSERRGVRLANDTVLIARDGTERLIEDSAAPMHDADTELIGVVMVFRDVTERRRAEQALQEASQRKDEFLAMLAHELRNPLAPIRNALQVLNVVDSKEPTSRRAREIIERQVEHLVRLVDDLLDVSRITRGVIQLQKERTDLAVIIARAVESSRALIDSRKHILTVTLPENNLPIQSDPVRLAQVILNLLNNAAKYTPEGGRIELSVTVEGEQETGRKAVVRVKDTGVGIAHDMIHKVFDLFTQVEHTLDRSEGGLGIGLTLVRRLVEMHGGTVACSSNGPGQGSEFVLRLPLAQGDRTGAESEKWESGVLHVASSAGLRILVVDDNRDSTESLATLLRLFGNDVRTAYEGRHALVVAGAYRPDLVLLDIGLPGLNGYEVAKQLRSMPGLKGSVLVALTGFGTDEDRAKAQQAGFDHHLVKPVDYESLHRLLASFSMPWELQ